MGEHLDSNPGHAEHIQQKFAEASVGTGFAGKSIDELKDFSKLDIRRQGAEQALKKILKDLKDNPPTA